MRAQQVAERLRNVYDPDLGLNVVALGLVYGIRVRGGRIEVEITVTSPGCPFSGAIADAVRVAAMAAPGVTSVEITIVTDPAWDPQMMEPAARAALGLT